MSVATQVQHHAVVQAGPGGTGLPVLPGVRTFILPLGFVDDEEQCHSEVELRPFTGQEQRMLASFPQSTPVATITTELLCRCLTRLGSLPAINRNMIKGLLVGDREFLLLKLYQMTFGNNLLALLNCPAEGCGESLEFPISLDACVLEACPISSRIWPLRTSEKGDCSIRFRLPTGGDQEALSTCCDAEADVLQQRLLMACCAEADSTVAENLSPEEQACIEHQMNRLAPQFEVEVEASCPACGSGFSTCIDIPYLALAEMKINEADLDWEIHHLAWHYHWPETEILALTPGRRRRYIELVQRELESDS